MFLSCHSQTAHRTAAVLPSQPEIAFDFQFEISKLKLLNGNCLIETVYLFLAPKTAIDKLEQPPKRPSYRIIDEAIQSQ